jgi:hypothetical protein
VTNGVGTNHGVGDSADAHLQGGAIFNRVGERLPICASTSLSGRCGCSCSGLSVAMYASNRRNGTTTLPRVLGICALISAISTRAVSAAALALSMEVPSVKSPWRSGGDTWISAASRRMRPDVKR